MKRIFLDRMSMMAILFLLPHVANAQDDGVMSFSEDEVEEAEAAPSDDGEATMTGEGGASAEAGMGGGGEADAASEGGAAAEGGGGDVSEADVLSVLGDAKGLDSTASLEGEGKGGAIDISKNENVGKHPIWAVQRIYVLRSRRVNLEWNMGFSMNDPYIQHQSSNLALFYYITEVLAIGITGNVYLGMNALSKLNFSAKRATHQVVPINEYGGGAQLNFLYVPIFGKFAMFKQWILHWDIWVSGGGGFIATRPKAVIDPDFRDFENESYNYAYSFNVAIGWRLFFSRFLAFSFEVRDIIFPETIEERDSFVLESDRREKSNWTEDDLYLTNNVSVSVGLSFFIPFTVKYRLKK